MSPSNRLRAACLVFVCATGCATTANNTVSDFRIIDRSAGHSEQPKWTTGKEFTEDKAESVYAFTSLVTMEEDVRSDSCTQAAADKSRSSIARYTTDEIMTQSGLSEDERNIATNGLTTSFTKQRLIGVRVDEKYWQIRERDTDGTKKRTMECWARTTIPKKTLDDAVKKAIADATKNPELKSLRSKLEKVQELQMSEQLATTEKESVQ